jgi:hypothetical protein
MVRLAFRRKLAVLVLSLALLTPWSAQALPLDHPLGEPLSRAVAHLTDWLTIVFGDVGCSWDPSGGCGDKGASEPAPTENLDVGCSWDPDGGDCRS